MGSALSQIPGRGEVLAWPAIIKDELVGPFWRSKMQLKSTPNPCVFFLAEDFFFNGIAGKALHHSRRP